MVNVPGLALNGKGWEKQPSSPSDWIYTPPPGVVITETSFKDLRESHRMGPPLQQGRLGSCTAHAVVSAIQYSKDAEGWGPQAAHFHASRLWIWYHAHVLGQTAGVAPPADELYQVLRGDANALTVALPQGGGTQTVVTRDQLLAAVKANAGTWIKNAFQTVVKYGYCSEDAWTYPPYDPHATEDPEGIDAVPPRAFEEARRFPALELSYWRIPDLFDGPSNNVVPSMEAAISEGYAVVFGFDGSDKSARLGDYADPKTGKVVKNVGLDGDFNWTEWKVADGETEVWGHAVLCVGFDRPKRRFLILNSWGEGFGNKGYFYMPYRMFEPVTGTYVNKNGQKQPRAGDFWVVKSPRRG